MGNAVDKKDLLKVAAFLGMGYYRVKESGEFVEVDAIARELFGIPKDETDLSKHSLVNLYIFQAERKLRIDNLKKSIGTPMTHSLSIRVKDEYRLLFDQCWCEQESDGVIYIVGLVKNIEDRVMSSKMFDEFPLGLYQLDEKKQLVNFNKKALEIFGYNKNDEENFLGKDIAEFYVNLEERAKFTEKLEKDGHAHDVLKFRNAQKEVIELECFTEHHNELNLASWGVIHDVTERQRYFRALDKMPTAYYYIEYNQDAKQKHNGKIKQCNEQYASILGCAKEHLIGKDVRIFHANKEESELFFKCLDEEDENDRPLLNYPFKLKRVDDGSIVHISVDSQLVKERGITIGREGTLRDITEKLELERKIKDAEERLSKTTADINNLIHTFMHPVLKFSGHSELFHQLGTILYKSIRHNRKLGRINLKKLGKELADKLAGIQTGLKYISENSESASVLTLKFEKIINVFDYELNRAEESNVLLDKAIRDTALWILEELGTVGFFDENIEKGILQDIITSNFIQYVEDLLFEYLIRTAGILKGETQAMRREVEALRRYITFEEKKVYIFRRHNLKKILEENIELFKPILAQRDIGIEYQLTGDLNAMISENDIDRVICNLFHNASKYSDHGPGRFVMIKSSELQRENAVELSIKNCGVPIKEHEIRNGDIFKFGYRGKLTYKMDRDGTGVGLADAKETIEAHGGTIIISSEPIKDDGEPRQYKVPYITTVTIKLPKPELKRR